MKLCERCVFLITFVILTFFHAPIDAFASDRDTNVPPDFHLISSASGVDLYRKDYPGGYPDFVQVIYLKQGARLMLLHGNISDPGVGKGAYGGNDPAIAAKSLKKFWKDATTTYPNTFCVSNGQFFKMGETPTRLPFALKIDGKMVSDGYAKKEHQGYRLMLELWGDRADIVPLSKKALFSSSAPDIVAGLTEDARKSPHKYVARTFVGIDDRDWDGQYETVLIFNTKSARQKDAARVLRDFGADKVMMLDGGGSTQLLCQGKVYVNSERRIPQVIATIAGGDVAVENSGAFAAFVEELVAIDNGNTEEPSSSESSEDDVRVTEASLIDLGDAKWILFVVLPIALILFLSITKSQPREYY